ncbi:glycoside hydrolase domain-containing protein [Streptomyces sp. TLI_171]|uniref:glycoside hydrolase domain-containing protein n=1 Tax=Streptomyces sp. TLI_171 TaxID=1938859 RepID=UPI000C5DDDCB|nr:glycoside hydrolase domain-containing protein [Streptomyces sp. TLI_171]RKE16941.1 uncharacterized protein DUF1906 [Streptomyces sp. TLI_171]
MPHRRRARRSPRGRRAALLSAAAVLAVGAGAAAFTATGRDSTGDSPAGAAAPATAPAAASLPAAAPSAPATGAGSAPASAAASGSTPVSPSPSVPAPASASASASVQAAPLPAAAPATFTGLAFDTCTAPSLATMNAWHGTSPYGAAAVYVGGRNRGCAQPQLTADWVRSVSGSGWRLVPLYVGAQPPCQTGNSPEKLTADTAEQLGTTDGKDAVAKAAALAMRPGSTLYLDVEAYNSADTACAAAVLSYVRSWNRAVHNSGYWAGFYGFATSSAAGIANAAGQGATDLPDALWYARYDDAADTAGSFPFAADLWTGHRRAHQYQINQKETYGGATVTVDRNAWDAPVALVG